MWNDGAGMRHGSVVALPYWHMWPGGRACEVGVVPATQDGTG